MTDNRYTALDGMNDDRMQAKARMDTLRLQTMPGITDAERRTMQTERDGITPEEKAARHAAGAARFAAGLEAGGLIPATGGPGEPVIADTRIVAGALPPDDRPDDQVCPMCLRTMRDGDRVEVRPDMYACRCCATLEQDIPVDDLNRWIVDHREYKRYAIAATYGVDPATMTAAAPRAEVSRTYEDADGIPLGGTQTPAIAAPRMVLVNTHHEQARKRAQCPC